MAGRKLCVALLAALGALVVGLVAGPQAATALVSAPSTLTAATLTVSPSKHDTTCPDAPYHHIRGAIAAAAPGDTVYVCPGTYVEGTGLVGSNALEIRKDLTLRGAGADQVFVRPKDVGAGQIAPSTPDLRGGKGDLLAVLGMVNAPVDVDVSGITFDAHGVYATAGIVFRDAGGSVNNSYVTGLVTDESKNGYQVAGGFRSNDYGVGIAMVTRKTPPRNKPATLPTRTLTIDHTRIDQYNAVGVLVDGSTGYYLPTQSTPLVPSGVTNRAIITDSVIAGRNSCQAYNDFTVGDPTSTTLAAASNAGDTNVKLGSVSSIFPGNTLTVDSGANAEKVKVVSVGTAGSAGTGVTVTPALALAHASGASASVIDADLGRRIVGDCQPSGSGSVNGIRPPLPLYVGPNFGQDGVRVTAGASVQIAGSTITSNLVHGAGAPVASITSPAPAWSIGSTTYAVGNHAENNQNLRLGAAVRLVGAAASSVTQSNITDNAFGVLNTTIDGQSNNTATPVAAQNDWWGLRTGTVTLPTPGPAVWTNTTAPGATVNPPVPENPVNGSPVVDAACPAGVSNSDSVQFCPYRSSTQSDSVGGEHPIPQAPIAQTDPAPCTNGPVAYDPNIPTYDSFFGSVLGGPNTGDGLAGGTPSAKKTAQLSAYMQAIADAINNNPGTSGQRVGIKVYQSGTSVLGVPFYVAVVGTPSNIANLDAGRNDAGFWRGVIDGTTSQQDALAAVDTRPAFGWITGTPHGNEPAGGEGSVKELYELAARTDCSNIQRLNNLDVFIQPVTAPDDRDHNVRTTAWSLDPNRDRGVALMPENRALLTSTAQYPGLFFIDAHQQSSGYFFPPNEDAALNEISHQALDLIDQVIGPGIQQQFNDQSSQYRNYNTYDLFVPEYGDTVPSLIMGAAGMTYEKGTSESYGKQVYDHYLAMDATVNVIAARKAELLKNWIPQWPQAVQQGQDCQQQGNRQVSPVVVDVLDGVGSTMDQDPNTPVCGFFYLPNAHSGDVATTMKDLQSVHVQVYKLNQAVTVPGVHRFGNFNQNAPGLAAPPPCNDTSQVPPNCPPPPPFATPSPALTETMTLPAGTLYVPLNQGTKHWILSVLGENPFLPFPYFYDQTTWSYSLLRGFSGDGFLTQQMPAGTSMSVVFDPSATTPASAGSPVYAFNTDSMSALSMATQLLSQGASVSRGAAAFDSGGVHFTTGAALVDGTSIPLATLNADSQHWGTPVYGLSSYPVSHYALRLPKIGIYTGGTTTPTNPTFHGSSDGQCTSTSYCEAMYDLSVKEQIPVSQIGQITSTDLANGVLISGGYTAFVNPGSTIAAGTGATALQNFVNAGGIYIGSVAGGTTSARNAGITLLNTSTISGLSTPGSTFDGAFSASTPGGWGFDTGGWIYRSASGDPTYNPATMVGNGSTIPAPSAIVTYGPSGDCGGPVFDVSPTARGYSNCYGYEVNANNTLPAANTSLPLPGRPAVVDQPFGAGHAILIGFDPWYRMWTYQEERLVLNGVLYPAGSAIPPTSAAAQSGLAAEHASSPRAPIPAAELPAVRNRPVISARPAPLTAAQRAAMLHR
jgi:hypothetical protein